MQGGASPRGLAPRVCGPVVGAFAVFLLTACATFPSQRVAIAEGLSADAGWEFGLVEAGRFDLAIGLSPGAMQGPPSLPVYIEGDGFAWISRWEPSRDPTPRDPLALRLALADGRDAVAYLARPCQYAGGTEARGCHVRFWTEARYSAEVADALDRGLDAIKQRTGAQRLRLVGYSGGGAMAALLAARRTDVEALITVAANLDLTAWTRHHDLPPLSGSLDPAHSAERLRAVPQVHFTGAEDETVPPLVAESYQTRLGTGHESHVVRVEDADHDCCWVSLWPDLLYEAERLLP